MNVEDARSKLDSSLKNTKNQSLILVYQNKSWQESFSDLEVNYDIDRTIENLYLIGHGKNNWQNIKDTISTLLSNKKISASFSYNYALAYELFSKVTSDLEIPTKDASLKVENDKLTIMPEQAGKTVDLTNLETNFSQLIGFLEDRKINIIVEVQAPKILETQLRDIKPQMAKIIADPILLNSTVKSFEFNPHDLARWIDIVAEPSQAQNTGKVSKVHAKNTDFSPKLIINPEKIKFDIEKISWETNQEPVDAKLTILGGKAIVATPSRDGYSLDQNKTVDSILEVLSDRFKVAGESTEANSSGKTELELPLTPVKPAVANDTINNLGIKELIGKGTTNFRGSPANRITNIKVGSSMFNGALIKPGEVFSTIKTLGEISTAKGYLPELVIKEDTTKPEVGGGLCQVSTTLFRAALNSGLPVTERSNHRYRVSYYEPPVGMDATIYDPSPDLKFENNTPGYILIQTIISGNELTFEFYGTKDGRKVEISDPVLYDVVSPGDSIYKEDPSLAPGEVVQKEKAHNGSKTSFYYKVTSSSGQLLTEKTFVSSYTPWRAVYLVGPGEAPPESQNQEQTQSSPESSPSPSPTSSPTPSESPTPIPSPTPSSS